MQPRSAARVLWIAAALLGAVACDGSSADVAIPGVGTSQNRRLLRVTEGDRELRLEARSERTLEGVMPSKGGRIALQQPGHTRFIELVLYASLGGGRAIDLARLTSHIVWERDATPAQLADFDVDRITVEHCRDPGASPRVAFRMRAAGGGAVPEAPAGWIGVFMLANAISPVRHVVEAPDCAAALAALPPDAAAWIRGELGATPAPRAIHRRNVALREGAVWTDEGPTGARSVNGAAIVAASQGIAADAVLSWSLHVDAPPHVDLLRERIPALAADPAAGRSVIAMLGEMPEGARPITASRLDLLALVDRVPADVAASAIGPAAASAAAACRSAPSRCTEGQLAALGRLAARAADRTACTHLIDLVAPIGAGQPAGEGRARTRMAVFREVATCAEPAAMRRAALDLMIGPYDDVSGSAHASCNVPDVRTRLDRCTDVALLGMGAIPTACDPSVVPALLEAAPRATERRQRTALGCAAEACGGDEARAAVIARMPPISPADDLRDCWPSDRAEP